MASIFGLAGNDRWQSSAPYVQSSALRSLDGRFVADGVAFEWTGMTMLDQGFSEWGDKYQEARRATADALAPLIASYAKSNAPWADRTGSARAGLKATTVHRDAQGQSDIYLGHSVFYGVFLETKTYGGMSYAIIAPTLAHFAPLVMGEFSGRVR